MLNICPLHAVFDYFILIFFRQRKNGALTLSPRNAKAILSKGKKLSKVKNKVVSKQVGNVKMPAVVQVLDRSDTSDLLLSRIKEASGWSGHFSGTIVHWQGCKPFFFKKIEKRH